VALHDVDNGCKIARSRLHNVDTVTLHKEYENVTDSRDFDAYF